MAKKPAARKTPLKKAASARKAAPPQKAAAAKKAAKPLSARDKLAGELVSLISEIDAEGMLFLIRQANVLLHNKRVDELNAEMERLNKNRKEAHKRAGTTARVGQNVEEITVEIQKSPDAKTYYIIVDEQKHFFTAEEMASVVKLCFKPERKSEALRYLYQYMNNERKEVLMDHSVSTEKHPFFEALFYEVRSKFSLDR